MSKDAPQGIQGIPGVSPTAAAVASALAATPSFVAAVAALVGTPVVTPPITPPVTPPVGTGPAPTNLSAIAWPYTILLSFSEAVAPSGKTIVSYSGSGVNSAWLNGKSVKSPLMIQGGNPGILPNSYTIVANYSDGTSSAPSAAVAAPATLAGQVNSLSPNVYKNGVYYWDGDFNFGGFMSYADQSLAPTAAFDAMYVCLAGQGGWLTYAPNGTYDVTPYKFINLMLKPTTAGMAWDLTFYQVGDISVGNVGTVGIMDASGRYGAAPQVGVWGSYKIPLADLGIGPGLITNVYKFNLRAHVPVAAGAHWGVQEVFFSAT